MKYLGDQITHEAFCNRVTELIERTGQSIHGLASVMGVPDSVLKNPLYKGTEPKRSLLIKLAEGLNTNVEYLVTGSDIAGGTEGTISIPVHTTESLAASLGLISTPIDQTDYNTLPFKSIPLQRIFLEGIGVKPDNCRMVVVGNDSMSPALRPGQYILVDASPDPSLREGIFIVKIKNSVVLRRATPIATGYILTADNSNIPGTSIPVDENNKPLESGSSAIVARVFMAVHTART